MFRSLTDRLEAVKMIEAETYSADTNGTGIDLQGADSILIIVDVGDTSATPSSSRKLDINLQHSNDNSTYVDVNGKFIIGASSHKLVEVNAAAKDNSIYAFSYIGERRYIRIELDLTGTMDTDVSVIGVKGNLALR